MLRHDRRGRLHCFEWRLEAMAPFARAPASLHRCSGATQSAFGVLASAGGRLGRGSGPAPMATVMFACAVISFGRLLPLRQKRS